MLGHVIKN